MPAINEHLKVDESIAAQLARAAGMNQIVVLPVIRKCAASRPFSPGISNDHFEGGSAGLAPVMTV